MTTGDFVSITYVNQNKNLLAIFLEKKDDIYFFKNKSGLFGVTGNALRQGDITFEVIED